MPLGKIAQFGIEIQTANQRKIGFILFLVIAAVMISGGIISKSYLYMLILFCLGAFLFLYLRQFEAFILLVLILNHEVFYLLPREVLGKYRYQGFLYIILLITGLKYFFSRKRRNEVNFNFFIISFFLMVIMSALNSYFQGQPLGLASKGEIGYYLILFYFIFTERSFNTEKLFKLLIFAGLILTVLNNLQYIFFKSFQFFHYLRQYERVGHLRLAVGDYFLIFSSILALSEFLRRKKKIYLIIFIYMVGTYIIQMQIRATMWGFTVTILSLMYLSKRFNFIKAAIVSIAVLASLFFIAPVFRSTVIGELFDLTKYEILEGRGNVGPRYTAYDYYFKEIKKSPIIGRGVWNVQFKDEINPDNLEDKGVYLEDIGIISILFHFGLIGIVWLILLLAKIYRVAFSSFGKLKKNIYLGPIGYLIFGISAWLTLNCFATGENIIYLALILSILTKSDYSSIQSYD